jgi:hypothetical protein
VTDLYLLLFTSILSPSKSKPAPGHGREGYYFGSNGEHSMSDVYNAVAKVLFDLGKTESMEPTQVLEAELKANPYVSYFHQPVMRRELTKPPGYGPGLELALQT